MRERHLRDRIEQNLQTIKDLEGSDKDPQAIKHEVKLCRQTIEKLEAEIELLKNI